MGLRGLAARAAVLCALVAAARGAGYGERCSKTTDCDETAPFCSFFFFDDSYERNTVSATNLAPANGSIPQWQGVCVQCLEECDCGVNQYCGVDPEAVIVPWGTLRSDNDGNGANAYQKKVVEVYARSFEGMKIRSKCMDYSVPETVCKDIDDWDLLGQVRGPRLELMRPQTFTQVREQNLMGTTTRENFKVTPQAGTIPRGYQERFCGKINVFAPEFHEVVDLVEGGSNLLEATATYRVSRQMSTGDYFDTSAQCPKFVLFRGSEADCNACNYNQLKSTCWQTDSCVCGKESERNDGLCCAEPFLTNYNKWEDPSYKEIRNFNDRRCGQYPTSNEGFNNDNLYYTARGAQQQYRTCSDACQPRTTGLTPGTYDRTVCYDANANSATPSGNVDQARYCQCVLTCEKCVADNGGCGKAPAGYIFNQPGTYQDLFGTCSGPCRANAQVAVAPPAASASDYSCPPAGLTPTTPRSTCLPSCVDCLSKAMETNCNAQVSAEAPYITTASNNACPRITPKIRSVTPLTATACSIDGKFGNVAPGAAPANQAGIGFDAPVVDWKGVCESGSCKICTDGQSRCSTGRGIRQRCMHGKWWDQRKLDFGVPEFDAYLQSYIATAVFVAFCFLALLGVIIAVCLSKPRRTATVLAAGPPKATYAPPPAPAPAPAPAPVTTIGAG